MLKNTATGWLNLEFLLFKRIKNRKPNNTKYTHPERQESTSELSPPQHLFYCIPYKWAGKCIEEQLKKLVWYRRTSTRVPAAYCKHHFGREAPLTSLASLTSISRPSPTKDAWACHGINTGRFRMWMIGYLWGVLKQKDAWHFSAKLVCSDMQTQQDWRASHWEQGTSCPSSWARAVAWCVFVESSTDSSPLRSLSVNYSPVLKTYRDLIFWKLKKAICFPSSTQ